MNSINPQLIEPGVKLFLGDALSKYKQFKKNNFNMIFNFFLFLFISSIIFIICWYGYKNKLTYQQRIERNKRDRDYIINKVNLLNNSKWRNY